MERRPGQQGSLKTRIPCVDFPKNPLGSKYARKISTGNTRIARQTAQQCRTRQRRVAQTYGRGKRVVQISPGQIGAARSAWLNSTRDKTMPGHLAFRKFAP